MKLNIIYFALLSLIFYSCASMQKPVNEAYLSEMTNEEKARLDKIEMEIIAKKKDKDKTKEDYIISKQMIQVCNADILQTSNFRTLLLEREKLFTLTKDSVKLAEIHKKLKENETAKTQKNSYLKYNIAKKNEQEVLLEVKKSQMAVLIAKLDYEKAKIAKEYQSKRPEKFSKKDLVDDKKYKKFLDDQLKKLDENKLEHKKKIDLLTKADEELGKSGYKEE
ncbi:MAG: hypothetical protein SVR08_06880 [Spirochaetota bacterium]|nr:hypothetical protein [Spirochaetota bacterium]